MTTKNFRRFMILLSVVSAFVLLQMSEGVRSYDSWVRVVRVNDGDTITVKTGAEHEKKVRLIGIDAPEMGQRPWVREARGHMVPDSFLLY